MGLLDVILGRTKPVEANLDKLFALPGARITLEASEGLVPTGQAGVCFKPSAGQGFAETEQEIAGMLAGASSGASAKLSEEADEYGYRWVVVGDADFDDLVTHAHFVNSTLREHGYGPQLLCSVFGFAPGPAPGSAPGRSGSVRASTYLVYLYKRGTFYPFVPAGAERRDNEAELRLKAELGKDLSVEPDLERWFPLWGLPVY